MEPTKQKHTEWLETNGLGSFAAGSVDGTPSRRYHGYLCASLTPPTERHLLVSHIIERVLVEEKMYNLSTPHYVDHRPENEADSVFKAFPYAHWDYKIWAARLSKSVTMLEHENTTMVRYTNTGSLPLTFFLKPLLALRDFHDLRAEGDDLEVNLEGNTVMVQAWGQPKVYMSASHTHWERHDDWYHSLFYVDEDARGFEAQETNFLAAEMEASLAPNESLLLRFSTEMGPVSEEAFTSKDKAYKKMKGSDTFKKDVELSAQNFVVHRDSSNGLTIMAGYPWFSDWGRDTLIALRDFQDFMALGEAQLIIKTFLQYQRHGLIPNRFPDDPHDEIEYNTIDASLWLFVAVWELHQKSPDKVFIEQIFETLTMIIEAHLVGTDFNIGVLDSGLLSGGEAPWQLTWMDAKIGDHTVTPRRGCPVEINCLWYNALKIYQSLGKEIKQSLLEVEPWIEKFEASFVDAFWNVEDECLYDVLGPDGEVDKAIRPNQVYALSLPFTVLTNDEQQRVLECITQKLYTPLGLRTLDSGNEAFKAVYAGGPWERDAAYHQGTVWPMLLRDYWEARWRLDGRRKTRKALQNALPYLESHFYHDAGAGSVSEVFDGASPTGGKGCPQQA